MGITLPTTSYKTFTMLIKVKLETIAERLICEHKAGFIKNIGTNIN